MLVGDKTNCFAFYPSPLPHMPQMFSVDQVQSISPFTFFRPSENQNNTFFQVQPCCRQLRESHTPWEQFRYSASIKWGLPKAAPWQVCSTYTQHWKQEPAWVWGGRDDEEKLQNEGSRRSLTFSTYLNKTA